MGSHHNTERLSADDPAVVLEDIDELDGLFRCPDCIVVVSSESYDGQAKTISCKCGKFKLTWKD
jgi:hypothetical protein